MKEYLHCSLIAVTAIALLAAPLHPQSKSANADAPLVTFPFFVTDRNGDPVSAVTAANITVLDDGKPPASEFVIAPAKGPLRLALVIDDSGSEHSSQLYPAAVNAAGYFVRRALPTDADRAMVVVFSDKPQATAFMDRNQFNQFTLHLARRGSTALYDAILSACNGMYYDVSQNPRRMLVIVAQGDDNSSRATLADAITAVEHMHGVMFLVETAPKTSEMATEKHERKKFEDAVTNAGGFIYGNLQSSDLNKTFVAIQQRISAEMIASYRPAPNKARKSGHSIQLKPVDPSSGWRVHGPKTHEER